MCWYARLNFTVWGRTRVVGNSIRLNYFKRSLEHWSVMSKSYSPCDATKRVELQFVFAVTSCRWIDVDWVVTTSDGCCDGVWLAELNGTRHNCWHWNGCFDGSHQWAAMPLTAIRLISQEGLSNWASHPDLSKMLITEMKILRLFWTSKSGFLVGGTFEQVVVRACQQSEVRQISWCFCLLRVIVPLL